MDTKIKKTDEWEEIGIKDFNDVLYAEELKYDKINEIYKLPNHEICTKKKNSKSRFKLEIDQIVIESDKIKIKEVNMKKIKYKAFILYKSILEQKERLIYVYKKNNDTMYIPIKNRNYFIKEEIKKQ
ncbi:hypothetical protein CD56_03090 [Campylobacter lari]|uniref:hypothetical protein n=1 Tax=Campylobacter lari TaxID=201 RepID=UPI0006401B5D|nr:hypothetical protein [Campylobacter lari]AKJ53369.1 hypothetical protein CD56_03090 [Campylobacter lari]